MQGGNADGIEEPASHVPIETSNVALKHLGSTESMAGPRFREQQTHHVIIVPGTRKRLIYLAGRLETATLAGIGAI